MSHAATRVLLTGATGFVGSNLYDVLVARGHAVRCGSRDPERASRRQPDREWVRVDVDDPSTLPSALEGCTHAVYLVHAMAEGGSYDERERRAAHAFAAAAHAAGVERVVYLGGVAPAGRPSRHLASRLATGAILRLEAPGAVELRAGMIIGPGSESWQICRDLAARLPVMILPRWLESRSRPIALDDVLEALALALEADVPPGCYDLPGPETLRACDILRRVAHLRGLEPVMVPVPVLTPRLSSYWLRFVTRADFQVARELVEGLTSDLLGSERSFWDLHPNHRLRDLDSAAAAALGDEPSPTLRTRVLEGAVWLLGRRWKGDQAASTRSHP